MRPAGGRATVLALLTALFSVGSASGQASGPASVQAKLGKLPLYFVENRGVHPDEVKYTVQGANKTLFFTSEGVTFLLHGRDRGWVVKLEFVGADPDVRPEGADRQEAVFSYFKGPESEWKSGLTTYAGVVYRDLWPGIDLVYHGAVTRLKYEFVVAPGADPSKIRLRYRGADGLGITERGALRVETPAGGFDDAPPVAWQKVNGQPVNVDVAYRLNPEGTGREAEYGFCVGDYDRARPLILDPAIFVYCGYIGGILGDGGQGIAVDAQGNTIVGGSAWSNQASFPVKVGPDVTLSGQYDAFVAKVNAAGTGLVYCGYIGGAHRDAAVDVAVDDTGNAYVTGFTLSTETTFPVKAGPDLTYNGGAGFGDAFVAKVDASGKSLHYCGYIGGSGSEVGYGIAVDAQGFAHVTGTAESDEKTFPVVVGPDLTHNGGPGPGIGADAFVAKVSGTGKSFVYCGYIGGSSWDSGSGIALDSSGHAYVTGPTDSTQATFPVKVGPDLTFNGTKPAAGTDGFVAKVSAAGTGLVYCGYIGGSAIDAGAGVAVGSNGEAYVVGYTASTQATFPVKIGPDITYNGAGDAFVARVNAKGSELDYCGYIGGSASDEGQRVAVDASGHAHVIGNTRSTEATFPSTVGPDLTHNGGNDCFVARVDASGRALIYCGYVGGAADEWGYRIALDASGNAYVTGETRSDERTFPVTVGPDLTHNGSWDAFVAKVALLLLHGSGTPRPGGTVSFALTATADAGLPYQIGSSLGAGPIPLGQRKLGLSPDSLLFLTVSNHWPSVFAGYCGVIGKYGQAKAAILIPGVPALIGQRVHSAFVTLSPGAPFGIKSISNTFSFSITK